MGSHDVDAVLGLRHYTIGGFGLMGFNTSITVCNDMFGQLEKYLGYTIFKKRCTA